MGEVGQALFGVVEEHGMPAHERMLQLAEQHPNLWLDLDDWQRDDHLGPDVFVEFLRRALRGPVGDRVMFGSDYPIFGASYSESDWIGQLLEAGARIEGTPLAAEELERFFSTNALRFCGLDLTADADRGA